jgi:hypothetical protein
MTDLPQALLLLFLAAVLIEAVVETVSLTVAAVKDWWAGKEPDFPVKMLTALLIGIFVAVAAGLDLFALGGVNLAVPYAGAALSGIIFSRGANYAHDIISQLKL